MTYFPTQSTLTIGGLTLVDPNGSTFIYLVTSIGANAYGTFRKLDASSGYTPSGSNKFKCLAGWFIPRIRSGTSTAISLGYGNTDVGVNSSSAPTSPVQIGGDSNVANVFAAATPATDSGKIDFLCGGFLILNTKYGYVQRGDGTSQGAIWLVGYEVA